MSKAITIKSPTSREKITLRLLILIGLLSFVFFFYWFLNPNYIESRILFWLLFISICYDTLKILYIWYHYWDISIPTKPVQYPKLTVDVLTTYFPGEPYEMTKTTLLAIQRMTYPHTTYLCDEANDEHLKNFCLENHIVHVSRNNRIDAKAGNINNALRQATGDICLILDPDHIPSENFLDEVIPYFADEKIGFVQTVQAYYNVDQSFVARGAAEQTFHFYGPVMMSMNSYGTVNAIGANCVFRRKALDSIGGHAPGLSEDMHTAMQLHAKGWKSVYVPKIFTKGLVPETLTSYYKQQLKWSRGTLDLLVNVFPRLFKNFTWRQRIHYGILPFHYISGVSYLISFIVPIISLFTATTPWKGNILNFALISAPVLISILAIRFYVQRWVMYKSERGIHILGGLLQTCTWWIFNIGLIYTLIRKKVPYLPTPKEDKELTSWKILVPNLLVGIISIISILYGLSIDYTPFSVFMSGFALVNAIFMFYTIYFAYQKPKEVAFPQTHSWENDTILDQIQNKIFKIWRKVSLPVAALVLAFSLYSHYSIEYGKWYGVKPEVQDKNLINYLGIFAPEKDNGISSIDQVAQISAQIREKFDVISLYIAWDKNVESSYPGQLLTSIYQRKSIPLITWEPWINTFDKQETSNYHVFDLISSGYFDRYIKSFAVKLKELKRPVFLRFAHEFDNPFYPWYVEGDNAPLRFKTAWIHTYEIFKDIGADNVIWVWNPWKADHVEAFYPGREYVDWFGVNILNYGKLNQDGQWHHFDELYLPFHDRFKGLSLAPVMITEFGSLKLEGKQDEWIRKAFVSVESQFSEIKSVIYFNSEVDNNWPKGLQRSGNLDWTIDQRNEIKNSFSSKEVPDYVFEPFPLLSDSNCQARVLTNNTNKIIGINIKKGHDWRRDYHVLSRKNLLPDFDRMKQLGVNTIKFEGNSIYDYNLLKFSKDYGFNVSYGFWIPEQIDFMKDTVATRDLRKLILGLVKKYRNDTRIVSWNIQNDVQYNQKDYYLKPRLFYQKRAYVSWLRDLLDDIRILDQERPIIVDLEVNQQTVHHVKRLVANAPEINYIGLVVKEDKYLDQVASYLKNSGINYLYSEVSVPTLLQTNNPMVGTPFFITSFQDRHESNKLTFDGLLDRKDRPKADYFRLQNFIQQTGTKVSNPIIRVLKPATLLYENKTYEYNAMIYNEKDGWKFGSSLNRFEFEWSLIKCDAYGNYLAVKDIGTGGQLALSIPPDYEHYRLLLTTMKGDTVISTNITTLNTPIRTTNVSENILTNTLDSR